ncbi:MAG: DUF3164 family protein [Deltaproteobacteria bacterium]|nr:DUF3164 family protein [Deltaproteobacteria bacterium]
MAVKNKEGWWIDAKGDAIPPRHVRPEDKLCDRVVEKLIGRAHRLNADLEKLKRQAFEDIETYIVKLESIYDVKARTQGGNKQLSDFAGLKRVSVKVQKLIDFDTRIELAKQLIDDCVKRWSKGSDDRLVILINDAFKVDKKGKLDRDRILGLLRLKLNDSDWQKAMGIIKDAIYVSGKRAYIQFAEREAENGIWRTISLDIAGV